MSREPINIATSYQEMRNEFRASKMTRFSSAMPGVNPAGTGADYHYRIEYQYLHMLERARHFERNDMVIGQAVRRLVSNVIQGGFHPDPSTNNPRLNEILKEKWAEWSCLPDECHSEGEFTFHQLEKLTLRSAIRDGDIFHLLLENGSLQSVEGHRPRTPNRTTRNVVNGIMLDDTAKRNQIWIAKEDLSPMYSVKYSDIQAYDVRDAQGHRQVLQVYFPDRLSQRRGITAFAPITDIIGMHDDLQFSTLVKAQLASLLVILREQPLGTPAGADTGPPIGGYNVPSGYTPEAAGVGKIDGVQAGIDYVAPPGQKIKGFSPDIPNPAFFEHTMLLLGFIAINLDLPLQVMLLDPMKSNFSSWRGAIDQARTRFREIQMDMIQQFHRPIWNWKVRQWASQSSALRKMIGNNPAWLKHSWKKPAFAYIEPLKDAQAAATRSEKFLSPFSAITGELGNDWDEVAPKIISDRLKLVTAAIEGAMSVNEKYGEETGLTWRDLLSPTLGAVLSSSVSRTLAPEEVEEEDPAIDSEDEDSKPVGKPSKKTVPEDDDEE